MRIIKLALLAGQGDPGSLATFIRATQRDVHRFLCHLCERGEAEDLTQETYLRALHHRNGQTEYYVPDRTLEIQ
ncbi:MAG: sigma factor [Pseudonocardiaceae bacterium]